MTLRVRFHHHLSDVTIHEACQLWCAVCFKIIYMGIIITTGKAKASIIPTRFLFCTDLVCWKIDSVFVLHRLGFCQKSTRFLSKIDSVFSCTDSIHWKFNSAFVVHRLDPLKNQLSFCVALTRCAEKSAPFLSCTASIVSKVDSVGWKIDSVFLAENQLGFTLLAMASLLPSQPRSFLNNTTVPAVVCMRIAVDWQCTWSSS